jgi:hypothetical protein
MIIASVTAEVQTAARFALAGEHWTESELGNDQCRSVYRPLRDRPVRVKGEGQWESALVGRGIGGGDVLAGSLVDVPFRSAVTHAARATIGT